MATYTTNLNLKKPADADSFDIADMNGNSDLIDSFAGSTSAAITNLGVYIMSSSQELLTVARDDTICPENTVRWINPRNGTVSGGATQYGIACVTKRINSAISVKVYSDSGNVFSNGWNSLTGDWTGWQQLALKSDVSSICKVGALQYLSNSNPVAVTPATTLSIVCGEYGTNGFMYMIYRASATNASACPVKSDSNITASSSNGTITFSNSSSNTYRVQVISLYTE